MAKALDYVSAIGMENIAAHEHELTLSAMQRLKEINGMRICGEAEHKSSVISFLVGNIHHLDMGTLDVYKRQILSIAKDLAPRPARGLADSSLCSEWHYCFL